MFAINVEFEVLTAVVMRSSIFWDITPRSPLKVNRRFGGTCLHLQGRRIRQARNQPESRWQAEERVASIYRVSPEDRGDRCLRNVGTYYATSHLHIHRCDKFKYHIKNVDLSKFCFNLDIIKRNDQKSAGDCILKTGALLSKRNERFCIICLAFAVHNTRFWEHNGASYTLYQNSKKFTIFSLLSLIWKNKIRLMRSRCCLCVCLWTPPPLLTFECLNQSLWNLVRTSRHLSPSQRPNQKNPPISLCVCTCIPLSLLGNGSVKTLPR
jgi:hypothetical protein